VVVDAMRTSEQGRHKREKKFANKQEKTLRKAKLSFHQQVERLVDDHDVRYQIASK
jgi:hypothetical protein